MALVDPGGWGKGLYVPLQNSNDPFRVLPLIKTPLQNINDPFRVLLIIKTSTAWHRYALKLSAL